MIGEIGKAAGLIWKYLKKNGPQSLTALQNGVKGDKNVFHWAIGWLCREDKLEITKEKGKFTIALKE